MVTEGLGSYPCRVPRAARLVDKGDCIIIMSFDVTDEPVEPEMILVNRQNEFVEYLGKVKV